MLINRTTAHHTIITHTPHTHIRTFTHICIGIGIPLHI